MGGTGLWYIGSMWLGVLGLGGFAQVADSWRGASLILGGADLCWSVRVGFGVGLLGGSMKFNGVVGGPRGLEEVKEG